jgi:hypothetical protein
MVCMWTFCASANAGVRHHAGEFWRPVRAIGEHTTAAPHAYAFNTVRSPSQLNESQEIDGRRERVR